MSGKQRISVRPQKLHKKVNAGDVPTARKWSFSFRYWQEREYFGVGDSDTKWFGGLLDKLKHLSEMTVDEMFESLEKKDWWRFHEINWLNRNCPIKRSDLALPAAYQNDEEYPIFQFQLGKALGRVVGFFDEDSVFNIVLLDCLHNLQPSKDYNYQVNTTSLLETHYCALRAGIDSVRANAACASKDCKTQEKLRALIENECAGDTVVVIPIKEREIIWLQNLLNDQKADSLQSIFLAGILAIDDAPPKN